MNAFEETCMDCDGSGFSVSAGTSCDVCEGTGEILDNDIQNDKELTKDQLRLIKKGLPKDFLDPCKWCKGSGNDGGGYGACPDCQSTGYKNGPHAESYIEELMELSYQVNQTMLKILAKEHGFGQIRFIPKSVQDFVYTYLSYCYEGDFLENPELVQKEMMEELPVGTIPLHHPVGYYMPQGYVVICFDRPDGDVSLPSIEDKSIKMDSDGYGIFLEKDIVKIKRHLGIAKSWNTNVPIPFAVSYSQLKNIPESIKFHSPMTVF